MLKHFMKVTACNFNDIKTEIHFFQFIFELFFAHLAKPYRILYDVACRATWSLFTALGSHIISFAISAMFLVGEKGRLYSATNDKTTCSIYFIPSESGMSKLTGNVFPGEMNSLYTEYKQ